MTATLKDSKRRMYSTYWDAISQIEIMASERLDISEQDVVNVIKYSGQIESTIFNSDDIIDSYLNAFYSNFDIDSYATVPTPDRDNTKDTTNCIQGGLMSVYVNNTAPVDAAGTVDPYTATWIIEATAVTANTLTYSLTSSLEGSQGTSLLSTADTVSSNGDVTILSSAWENISSMGVGDKIYFSVIDVNPLIHHISVELTVSSLMQSVFNDISPNANETAETRYRRAIALLNKLQRPHKPDGLRLSDNFTALDTSSLSVAYKVTDDGYDISPYLDTDNTDGEYNIY